MIQIINKELKMKSIVIFLIVAFIDVNAGEIYATDGSYQGDYEK